MSFSCYPLAFVFKFQGWHFTSFFFHVSGTATNLFRDITGVALGRAGEQQSHVCTTAPLGVESPPPVAGTAGPLQVSAW